MKVIDIIKQSNSTLLSLEVLPPLKGKTIQDLYKQIDKFLSYKPAWINVTYHRSETKFRKTDVGTFEKINIRKRPGTVGICAAIKNHYKIEAVPHLICGGFDRNETEDALIDLNFLGIDNILVLRGDIPKNETNFEAQPNGHLYALDLIKQISSLNNGIYLDPDIESGNKTNFCMGIAGYPEKHLEAPNMNSDIHFTKLKIDAGAEYIMTQMFFDNKKFFEYLDTCRKANIQVPIIPGLKPITNKKQLSILPKIFNIEIPYELSNEMMKAKSDKECHEIGYEWLLHQCQELKSQNIPVLHFYTLGSSELVQRVIEKIF